MTDTGQANHPDPTSRTEASPTATEYHAWRFERQRRMQTLVFVMPALLALILLMVRLTMTERELIVPYSSGSRLVYFATQPAVLLGLLLMSTFGLAILYLQSGFKRTAPRQAVLYQYDDELRSC